MSITVIEYRLIITLFLEWIQGLLTKYDLKIGSFTITNLSFEATETTRSISFTGDSTGKINVDMLLNTILLLTSSVPTSAPIAVHRKLSKIILKWMNYDFKTLIE